MTDKAALKEDVKKLVRALLISAPLGLTVRQVEEDFLAVMGYRLPYQKLGYDSANELLKDMKDVVKPVWDRGQMKVMGICDETTKHIQKMVMRQRVDTRKRGGTSKITKEPPRSYRRMSSTRSTNNSNAGTSQSSNNATNSIKPRPLKPMNKPVVPAHLQFEIKELLILFPNGIHSSNFTNIFQDEYGYTIDFKRLNFESHLEMFKCIPDLEVEKLDSGGYRIHDRTQLKPSVLVTKHDQVKNTAQETSRTTVENQGIQKRSANFDEAFIKNLRTILSRNANGFWAKNLAFAYRKLTGIELKLSKYGFFSVIDLVSAMPDVITVERPNPTGDWLLFDARLRDSEPRPKQTRSKESCNEKKPEKNKISLDKLKLNVREVLEKKPGIVVQQLESAYEEIFGEELPLQDHGFMDVDTLVVMIPDTVNVIYKGRGRLHLYPSKNSSLGKIPEVYTSYKVPSDAIGGGVAYKYNDLPPLQQYIEVYVSNVVSPYNLTLQVKCDELLKLEDVMDELEEVYCSDIGNRYKMTESMITINQVCAALYQQDHNWHRAIITGIKDLDFVEVKYVDYGTTASIPKSLLRYLRNSMFHLPVQSYDARLSFLKPVQEKWTKEVQDRILQLCTDKALVALVTSTEGRELSVCLTDTSTDEDIHINDVLVNENLATFSTSTFNNQPYSEYSLVTGYGLDIPTLVYGSTQFGRPLVQENSKVSVIEDVKDENSKPCPQSPPRLTLHSPSTVTAQFDRLSIDPPAGMEEVGMKAEADTVVVQDVEELVDEELMEQMNREMAGDFDNVYCNRFIMYLDLGNDRTIHLINYNEVAYIPSANLRTLIDVDAVSQLMQIKQLGIKSVSLSREEIPELFAELDEYEVTRGPVGDGQADSSQFITLYPLEKIPSLVAVFEDESSELSSILTKVIEQFNPEDPYWKGDISPAENTDDNMNDDLDLLKLMLQVSERKRQRILIDMMEDAGNVMVDELTDIEQQIAFIKSKIKAMEIEKEEVERGVVGDALSQVHELSSVSQSRHTPAPTNDQDSHPDTGKESTEIVISNPSPVSVKSEKINIGDKKMNIVEPFNPSVDTVNLESKDDQHTEENKQQEMYNKTEQFTLNGTTYYNTQSQSNYQSNQPLQSYMHHLRPSLQQQHSYSQPPQTFQQTARPQPPPGLPLPPPGLQQPLGLSQHQPRPNMHIPIIQSSQVQANVRPLHLQPANMQFVIQQPYVQNQMMHMAQPQYNQPMSNQSQYNQPMNSQSQYNQPMNSQSQYNQPMNSQSQYNQPMNSQSQYNQPMNSQSQYNQPMNSQSQYNQPMNSQSRYNQPMNNQSQYHQHQNLSRFPSGQYYGNNNYPNTNPFNYGSYWSTQH